MREYELNILFWFKMPGFLRSVRDFSQYYCICFRSFNSKVSTFSLHFTLGFSGIVLKRNPARPSQDKVCGVKTVGLFYFVLFRKNFERRIYDLMFSGPGELEYPNSFKTISGFFPDMLTFEYKETHLKDVNMHCRSTSQMKYRCCSVKGESFTKFSYSIVCHGFELNDLSVFRRP